MFILILCFPYIPGWSWIHDLFFFLTLPTAKIMSITSHLSPLEFFFLNHSFSVCSRLFRPQMQQRLGWISVRALLVVLGTGLHSWHVMGGVTFAKCPVIGCINRTQLSNILAKMLVAPLLRTMSCHNELFKELSFSQLLLSIILAQSIWFGTNSVKAVLVRVPAATVNHHQQNQVMEEMVYLAYTSVS